jgi:anti-anti-sigma factor
VRRQLLAEGVRRPVLVLDMREVSFVDSAGLGLLLLLRKRCARMVLLGLHPRVRLLLSLLHLQGAFACFSNLAAALKSLARAPIKETP